MPWVRVSLTALVSFLPQGHHGVDCGGATRGEIAGDQGNEYKKQRNRKERERVCWFHAKEISFQYLCERDG